MTIVLLIGVTGFFGKFGMSKMENSVQEMYINNLQRIDEIHIIKCNYLLVPFKYKCYIKRERIF
ncbi:hypothetical protein DIC82_10735 [Clostridium beijerinckii]|nr:hypothetical protein DIC82_10735 [Clostridium beijerinckii]